MKRTIALMLTILVAAAALSGCIPTVEPESPQASAPISDTPNPGVPTSAPKEGFAENMVLSKPTYPAPIAYDDYEAQSAAREDISSDYIKDVLDFSYSAARKSLLSADAKQSAMTSPMSLYFVLAMLCDSASGESRDELLAALGTDKSAAYDISVEAGKLYRQLSFDTECGKCAMFNSMWLNRDLAFNKHKLDELAKNYYAESIVTDFSSDAYKSAIAEWIEQRTDGFLKPSPNAFDSPSDTLAMMLINTIYYKSEWLIEFSKDSTLEDVFNGVNGEVKYDFMNTMRHDSFYKGDGFTASALALKYGSMRFILPDEGVSVDDILNDDARFTDAVATPYYDKPGAGYGEVTWKLPKFTFDTTLDLTDTVKNLGFDRAFDGSADFSALTDEELFVSSVSQGSKVKLDENGVEAAAYTNIMMDTGAAMVSDSAEMILTRPFIFVIEYENLPLFVGVVRG